MKNKWISLFLAFSLPLSSWGQSSPPAPDNSSNEPWVLSEESLVQEVNLQAPSLLEIQGVLAESEHTWRDLRKNYQWNWVTEANYEDSNEKAIASFAPTFGPNYHLSTGVRKNFVSGVQVSAHLFTDQQSTADGSIDEATRTGALLDLSMDLWQNLLGRVSEAELQDQKLLYEKEKIESIIDRRSVELELRKTYWSVVANQEQMNITQGLLKASEAQLRDGLRRNRKHIADDAEVARLRAQVEGRKATLESLKASRDVLISSLKEQLPSMAEREFTLGPYDVAAKVAEVMTCTVAMSQRRSVAWEYTQVDELIAVVEKSFEQKKIVSDRSSDVDLQLHSALQVSGVDRGYSDSVDDFTNNGEAGYSVGLTLSVPLGSRSDRAKEARQNADRYMFLAEKQGLLARTKAQHGQIVSLVSILNTSLRNLERTSANLRESIRISEIKFKQARMSLQDLLIEQDALLNSLLQETDTKLSVVHSLLDYFKIFTEDPCSINQVGA